jgi:hypothetical protein
MVLLLQLLLLLLQLLLLLLLCSSRPSQTSEGPQGVRRNLPWN